MEIEHEHTFRHALNSGINLFTGAGFSVNALDYAGDTLPTGGELAAELREYFSVDASGQLSLSQLAIVIESTHKDALRSYLTRRFTVDDYDPAYRGITRTNINTWFSTNIDDLPYRLYESHPNAYINDVIQSGPELPPSGRARGFK